MVALRVLFNNLTKLVFCDKIHFVPIHRHEFVHAQAKPVSNGLYCKTHFSKSTGPSKSK